MKVLTNCDGLKTFIAPNMTYLIAYPDHHGKEVWYYGSDIYDIYWYLKMILYPTALTYSGQNTHTFGIKTNIY